MANVDFAQAMKNTAEAVQQQLAARDATIQQMKNRANNVVETYSAILQANTGAEVFRRAMELHSQAPDYGKAQIIETTAVEPQAKPVVEPTSLGKRLATVGLIGLGMAGAGGTAAYVTNKMTEKPAVVEQPSSGNLREQLKKEGYDRPPAGAIK